MFSYCLHLPEDVLEPSSFKTPTTEVSRARYTIINNLNLELTLTHKLQPDDLRGNCIAGFQFLKRRSQRCSHNKKKVRFMGNDPRLQCNKSRDGTFSRYFISHWEISSSSFYTWVRVPITDFEILSLLFHSYYCFQGLI